MVDNVIALLGLPLIWKIPCHVESMEVNEWSVMIL